VTLLLCAPVAGVADEGDSQDVAAEAEPAEAEPAGPSAEEVALQAQQVHSQYCGSLQGTDRGLAGESFAVVGPAWSRVSDAYQQDGPIFLLYWSGLLSECLGRYEDAIADLEAFLANEGSAPLVSMVADAKSRLRRRARAATKPRSGTAQGPLAQQARRVVPRLVPGIGLAAGAVAVGVAAGVEWNLLIGQHQVPQFGEADQGIRRELLEDNMQSLDDGQGEILLLGSIAVGLAVSSVISFVIAGGVDQRAKAKAGTKKSARLHVSPRPQGLALGVTASW